MTRSEQISRPRGIVGADSPRYDALGLFRGRWTQVGDLSRLKLRQRWLATERPLSVFRQNGTRSIIYLEPPPTRARQEVNKLE